MKKIISAVLALAVGLTLFTPVALADEVGEERVTMGADLTDRQREAVYKDFGIEEGSVTELTVTNDEERSYLEGLVPDGKIGSVAISCIYIKTLPAGSGMTVEIHNINYCTEDMYINALTTAGITDAQVIVSAPFPVSGTGALTGAYKAYEDITGNSLSSLAKSAGAEELVVTGELAEYIGSDDATQMITELKGMLDKTQGMTDDQVRDEIKNLATIYNVSLTNAQVEQVLSLVAPEKDVDGLHPHTAFDAATPTAINWLLAGYNVELAGKKIAIVGRGRLVGAPLEKMWRSSGYNVTVFARGDDLTKLKDFDIIVTATGEPRIITHEMVKPGTVLVDAGTASEDGKVYGDVAPEVRTRDDISMTPEKGGVGPLTVTALFDNVIQACLKIANAK